MLKDLLLRNRSYRRFEQEVRISEEELTELVGPLDLHVLSLSLAFILSQDQTLHCKILFRNFSGRVMCFMNLDFSSIPIHARYVLFISIS